MRWLLLGLLLSSCATVKPWQRSHLQSRLMAEPLDPLEATVDGHVLSTREFMSGADAAGGSSCGCD